MIATLILVVLGVMTFILKSLIGHDAKTLVPIFSRWLIQRSSQIIAPEYAPRFEEEWLAHLLETDLLLKQLWHALSLYFWGSRRVAEEVGFSQGNRTALRFKKRTLDLLLLFTALPGVAAVIFLLIIAFGINYRRPFVGVPRLDVYGRQFQMWRLNVEEMRTEHPGVHRFFVITSLVHIPAVFNILAGQMSLVGPAPRRPGQEVAEYRGMKPGIAGPRDIGEDEEAYASRASITYDLVLISKAYLRLLACRKRG